MHKRWQYYSSSIQANVLTCSISPVTRRTRRRRPVHDPVKACDFVDGAKGEDFRQRDSSVEVVGS